jgi:hypothetical protein
MPTAASTLFELRRGPYVRATQLRSAVVPQLTNPAQVLQMGHGSNFACKFWMLAGQRIPSGLKRSPAGFANGTSPVIPMR